MKAIKAPLLSVNRYGPQLSAGSHEWKNFRYHTVDQFHINKIEEYIRHSRLAELPLPPHRKEVFDFIFLTNGKITRSKGLDSFEFSKNSFFFLPAFQITTMQSMSRDAAGYYCHFNSDIFFRKLFQKELLHQFTFMHFTGSPVVQVDQQAVSFITGLLCRLQQEYRSGIKCDLDFVAATLLSLFFELKPFSGPAPALQDNAALRIANEYKSLLIKHVHEKQKVHLYADMLSITPEYLNRSVKTAFGKTAHHYLEEMVLLEAKVLLKQSTLNVSEIAYTVGKENPGDFTRFFKARTGLTPKQYRSEV